MTFLSTWDTGKQPQLRKAACFQKARYKFNTLNFYISTVLRWFVGENKKIVPTDIHVVGGHLQQTCRQMSPIDQNPIQI